MRPLKVGVQLPEVERVVPWPELRDIAPPAGGSVFVACCSPRDDSKQVTLGVRRRRVRRPRLDATESVAYSARKEVRDARADPYSGERPRGGRGQPG